VRPLNEHVTWGDHKTEQNHWSGETHPRINPFTSFFLHSTHNIIYMTAGHCKSNAGARPVLAPGQTTRGASQRRGKWQEKKRKGKEPRYNDDGRGVRKVSNGPMMHGWYVGASAQESGPHVPWFSPGSSILVLKKPKLGSWRYGWFLTFHFLSQLSVIDFTELFEYLFIPCSDSFYFFSYSFSPKAS